MVLGKTSRSRNWLTTTNAVVAYIPFVGYVTIMMSEHPWIKTVLLCISGLVVVMQRE